MKKNKTTYIDMLKAFGAAIVIGGGLAIGMIIGGVLTEFIADLITRY